MARPRINRRDFLNGMALSLAAGTHLSPLELLAAETRSGSTGTYPPALTGLRGSHPGSFDVAHAISLEGKTWPMPDGLSEAPYDLVVVGAGISGLSAARFFQERAGKESRILILDNHDDFGGQARRTEFSVAGRQLIGYGGSMSISSPSNYSRTARRLLQNLGIETDRFYRYYDQDFYQRFGLKEGFLFSAQRFRERQLVGNPLPGFGGSGTSDALAAVDSIPMSSEAKQALVRLLTGDFSFLEEASAEEREEALAEISAESFMEQALGMPADGREMLRDYGKPLWGLGADTVTALEYAYEGVLGLSGYTIMLTGRGHGRPDSGLARVKEELEDDEPYIFHFPDGNASIARMLVRELIPQTAPGSTMEDVVTAKVDYSQLDRPGHHVRIRLNSTAIRLWNTNDGESADVMYIRDGQPFRVRGKQIIAACWNRQLPYLCPDMGQAQRDALFSLRKIPLSYINVALTNWQPVAESGYHWVSVPGGFYPLARLDYPVSMGSYHFSAEPDDPVVMQLFHTPATSGDGTDAMNQARRGQELLLAASFDDFEQAALRLLDEVWGPSGMDVSRDVSAITVNRWPHGYAWEYTTTGDSFDYDRSYGPHVVGRQAMGRIFIANSDSEAWSYVDGAVDAADRAVKETLA